MSTDLSAGFTSDSSTSCTACRSASISEQISSPFQMGEKEALAFLYMP